MLLGTRGSQYLSKTEIIAAYSVPDTTGVQMNGIRTYLKIDFLMRDSLFCHSRADGKPVFLRMSGYPLLKAPTSGFASMTAFINMIQF